MCPLHPSANLEGGLGSHVETSKPPSSLPSSHLWALEMPPRGGSWRDRAALGVGGVPGSWEPGGPTADPPGVLTVLLAGLKGS